MLKTHDLLLAIVKSMECHCRPSLHTIFHVIGTKSQEIIVTASQKQ